MQNPVPANEATEDTSRHLRTIFHRIGSRTRLLDDRGQYVDHPINWQEPAIYEKLTPAQHQLHQILPPTLASHVRKRLTAPPASSAPLTATVPDLSGHHLILRWHLEPARQNLFWLHTELTDLDFSIQTTLAAEMCGKEQNHYGLLLDLSGQILWASQAFLQRTGWNLASLQGRPFHDFLRQSQDHSFLSYLESSLRRVCPSSGEIHFCQANGDYLTLNCELRPLRYPNRQAWCFILRIFDPRLELELRQMAKMHYAWTRLLLQQVKSVLFVADLHPFKISYVSSYARHALGLDVPDTETFWYDFTQRADQHDLAEIFLHQPPQNLQRDFFWQHPDGSRRRLRLVATSVQNKLKNSNIIGLIFDLTEDYERILGALQHTRQETVVRVASGLAHDFNNYLGAVMIGLDLIKKASPQNAAGIARVEKEVEICRQLARRMLLLTKPSQSLEIVEVELADLIKDAVDMALAGSKIEITLTMEGPHNLVRGNPDAISQIVFNLLLNAREAMSGSGQIRITVESTWDPDGHLQRRLVVSDSGPGIPPELKDRIFQIFNSTKTHGTGIGLYSSRQLAQTMGGDLILLSDHEKSLGGASFALILPAASDEHLISLATPPDANRSDAPTQHTAQALKIVLLDDQPTLRLLTTEALEAQGHTVISFAQGRDLLNWLQTKEAQSVDALILDMTVPDGLGGGELLPHIRKRLPSKMVILTSGYSSNPVWQQWQQTDPHLKFLPKPFKVNDLIQTLSQWETEVISPEI